MPIDVTKFASNVYPDASNFALIIVNDEVWGYFDLDEYDIEEVKRDYKKSLGFPLREEKRVIEGLKRFCLVEEG